MQHNELIEQVRHRAPLASRDDAARAIRAALQTLGERIPEELADNLAAQLPRETGEYLYRGVTNGAANGERFDRQEFVARVAARAGTRQQHAACLARTVFEVIDEAVGDGVMLKVAGSLPDDIAELVTGGSAD